MTSYHELTAGGESSPLFTGCCQASGVINRDLCCTTHPELCRREEGGLELEVASGLDSLPSSLSLCTSSDCPSPQQWETLGGFSTAACPHSLRVPWRRRTQGESSPGRGSGVSDHISQARGSDFGSLAEQIHTCSHTGPRSPGRSDRTGADMDERSKTFEWMKVRRSQHRVGKFSSKKLKKVTFVMLYHWLEKFGYFSTSREKGNKLTCAAGRVGGACPSPHNQQFKVVFLSYLQMSNNCNAIFEDAPEDYFLDVKLVSNCFAPPAVACRM